MFHVISLYAPTFNSPDSEKETFYRELTTLCASCRQQDELIIMGDFNARG